MAACAPNPPPPDGFKIWRGAPPPRPLSQWAVDLRDHWMPKVNYGDTAGLDYEGQYVIARKDHHTWTYRKGVLVSGICIPGITLYQSKLTQALAGAPGVGDALTTTTPDDLTTPDPTVAAYAVDPGTNWGLVALSGGAAVAVVAAFLAGLHFAGKAPERKGGARENPTKLSHRELAEMANGIARSSRYGGSAPRLVRTSSRKEVLQWLLWNDPNGVYTDANNRREGSRPLTTDEAWMLLEEMVTTA